MSFELQPGEYEAVQFGDWKCWHAVRPDSSDRTFCGLNAIKARSMWVRWVPGRMSTGNCERCTQSIEASKRKEYLITITEKEK